ncbi:hypothetical protein AUEXF2481DRAFT_183878 [Aureobasidium subglaciale EXF-2481]|uniref:F-box domain-containing protein n=1 Tax=Aureobasidium subglaciale (strain EXF-2481) TaxID=1043005 RepID=A0A074ZMH6_AURSE|nr:uncharacterized protein AUEXF2481DRAFT_183878 [Aureobasidium subglaciale EXF-2481]KEQ99561.1 hypothetical protein AUEXF2481DRAFT_183878 [Aureobasidium subglaciale EXF-2481]
MTSLLRFPNELMLSIFKNLTTIAGLLALSATSHDMRSLFINNASTTVPAVCEHDKLLSAAKALVDTISKIASPPNPYL